MDKIDKLLISSMAKKGLAGAAKSALVCFYAGQWGNGRFAPVSFSKGVLKVSVSSSSAASELQIEEQKLIDFINEKTHHQTVKMVRIIVLN